jgi:hypothetical protein
VACFFGFLEARSVIEIVEFGLSSAIAASRAAAALQKVRKSN